MIPGESARVWKLIHNAIVEIGKSWVRCAINERGLRLLCAECTHQMQQIARDEHHDLTGWSIHVWEPERIWVDGWVTLIAVRGSEGYDISALAEGLYGDDPVAYWAAADGGAPPFAAVSDGDALGPVDPERS